MTHVFSAGPHRQVERGCDRNHHPGSPKSLVVAIIVVVLQDCSTVFSLLVWKVWEVLMSFT